MKKPSPPMPVRRRRERVDEQAILDQLLKLRMYTWRYVHEDRKTKHLGPMAEDFAEAFKLGTNNRVIAISDAVGVAYASIRALNARIEERRKEIAALERRVARIERKRRI